MNTDSVLNEIKWDAQGLVTAMAVDHKSGQVVMLAYMNAESLKLTLETGIMTYYSRSRKKLWLKGETSGNTQKVISLRIDCDGDALLFLVEPQGIGAACHEGFFSCFFREWNGKDGWTTLGKPLFDPKSVYGN